MLSGLGVAVWRQRWPYEDAVMVTGSDGDWEWRSGWAGLLRGLTAQGCCGSWCHIEPASCCAEFNVLHARGLAL